MLVACKLFGEKHDDWEPNTDGRMSGRISLSSCITASTFPAIRVLVLGRLHQAQLRYDMSFSNK